MLRTYCVDTNLSIALGRPPGLSWDWINAQLPSLADDKFITPQGILDPSPSPVKQVFHHNILLRRLQGEIHRTLYSETAARREADHLWMEEMQGRLDKWRQDAPQPLTPAALMNDEWTTSNHAISISLLNRPCPGNQRPNSIELARALNSSRATMRIFKSMSRSGKISFGQCSLSRTEFRTLNVSMVGDQPSVYERHHPLELPLVDHRPDAAATAWSVYARYPGVLRSTRIFVRYECHDVVELMRADLRCGSTGSGYD